MAIAQYPSLVIDCPDPLALAQFYGAILDWPVNEHDDYAQIRAEYGQCIDFAPVESYRAPTWPSQDVPQQTHLDVIVEDLDTAEAAVVALGATRANHQPGETFRVMLDPAGHPFCLCLN